MPLSDSLIGELQVILKEEWRKDGSHSEAAEIGTNIVRYFETLAKMDNYRKKNMKTP